MYNHTVLVELRHLFASGKQVGEANGNIPLTSILAWILTLFITIAGCGGGGTTPDPGGSNDDNNDNTQVWTSTDATSAIANPGIECVLTLPFDGIEISRLISYETSQLVLKGSEFLQQHHCTVDGTGLHMVAPPEVVEGEIDGAWGLYKSTGLLECIHSG